MVIREHIKRLPSDRIPLLYTRLMNFMPRDFFVQFDKLHEQRQLNGRNRRRNKNLKQLDLRQFCKEDKI